MKVKVECNDCGFIFEVPPTPYKSTLYGDDIYLDSNCPRCDSQRFSVVDKNHPPSVIWTKKNI